MSAQHTLGHGGERGVGSRRRRGSIVIAIALLGSVFAAVDLAPATADDHIASEGDTVGLIDPTQGQWHLRTSAGQVASFYFGNPGDVPFMGDWDCDGIATPGLFRTSDAFAYLRNSNTAGIADIRFFFGNPDDVPIAGDFDGDGCDTVSIYRPNEQRFYIVNKLGQNEGGLGKADFAFTFGNPGDKPVVGDWDGDGADEVGLHRESTGFFYWRNSLTTGIADGEIFFGDPDDRFVAGDWGLVDGGDTPAVFRPADATFYFRHTLTEGVADNQFVFGETPWLPVSGDFGLPEAFPPDPTTGLGGVLIGGGEDIQIRALQAISGPVEFLGTDQVRGIELALAHFGPVKGHDVDLGTVEDDLCNSVGGTAGAQAIIVQPKVLGTIGTTCSGAGVPASKIISEAGQVMISGSNTSPALTSDLQGNANAAWNPGYYRISHNDLYQGKVAAQFAFEILGVTTAAAIHDGDPYTEGLASAFSNAFQELGGEVPVFTAVNRGETNMVPVLTEVAAGEPGVIYFPIFQPEGDFIIQQIDGVSGLEDVILFGADGLLVSDFMALPESEGMYFSGPDFRFDDNVGLTGVAYTDLVTDYQEEFGETPPAAFHAHAYDATMMILNAIDSVGVQGPGGALWVDRQGLRDSLYATQNFPGMTGTLGCDLFGDCGAQALSIRFHEDSTLDDPIGGATVLARFSLADGLQFVGP